MYMNRDAGSYQLSHTWDGTGWFSCHVLHRAVNNQDVIKMSKRCYYVTYFQLCKVRSFYVIDCTNWMNLFNTMLKLLNFHFIAVSSVVLQFYTTYLTLQRVDVTWQCLPPVYPSIPYSWHQGSQWTVRLTSEPCREWTELLYIYTHYTRVSTTPGNLLEFKWSSWKFLCNDRKLMWHCLCIEECNIKMLLML